jgi:ATP-dependent DNA helicase RecG
LLSFFSSSSAIRISLASARHRPGAAPAAALRGRDPLTPIGRVRDGETVQVEGVVRECRIEPAAAASCWCAWPMAPRRACCCASELLPVAAKAAGGGPAGAVRGECAAASSAARWCTPRSRRGRCAHAAAAGADAGLPHQRRSCRRPTCARRWLRAGARAAGRTAAAGRVPPGLPTLREALQFLHHPPPGAPLAALEDRSHPAWQRLKFEELLAQQLSQLQARRERAAPAAPALAAVPGGLRRALLAALPFQLTARSSAWATRSPPTWRRRSRCTACCRATWARARRWWPRWPRPWPSTPAGNAR